MMFIGTKIRHNTTDEKDTIVNYSVSSVPDPDAPDHNIPMVTYVTKGHGAMEADDLFKDWHAIIDPAVRLAPVNSIEEVRDGSRP